MQKPTSFLPLCRRSLPLLIDRYMKHFPGAFLSPFLSQIRGPRGEPGDLPGGIPRIPAEPRAMRKRPTLQWFCDVFMEGLKLLGSLLGGPLDEDFSMLVCDFWSHFWEDF